MSLCKLHTVKSARKPQGKCGKCGTAIEVGDGYRWWQGRYTGKRVRCMAGACTPRVWERETNSLRQEHMQAEDEVATLKNEVLDPQAATQALQDAIAMAESVRDQLQERLDGWAGTNLEYSQQYDSCTETVDALDTWLQTAEGVASALDQLSDDASSEDVADEIDALDDLPELDMGA